MIVRDEEDNLDRCLRSVRAVADELIVVDTGSRDRTVEIAHQHGAKVSYFEWCDDFAAARNDALAQAKGRWILQMDADEELVVKDPGRLRRLVTATPDACWGFFIPVHLHESEGPRRSYNIFHRLLLFRNHPDLRYFSRIHEQLRYVGRDTPPEFRYSDELIVEHFGYVPSEIERKRKHERNLRLLSMALAEQPDEPFHHFNLGQQYEAMGRHAEAVEPLRQAITLCKDPRVDYLPMAYTHLLQALRLSGLAAETPAVIAEAEARLPWLTADFYYSAGAALQEFGRSERALAYFQKAIETGQVRSPVLSHHGVSTWLPRLAMGKICESRGEMDLARGYYEEALTYVPEHAELSCRLATVLACLGQSERALEQVRSALETGPVPDEVCWELLQVCERLAHDAHNAQQVPPDLKRLGAELVQRVSPTPERGLQLVRACVRYGQYEQGIAAANAVLGKGSDLLVLAQRGICHFQLGHFREAAADFEAAMALESADRRVEAGLRLAPQASAATLLHAPRAGQPPPIDGWPSGDLAEVCRALARRQETYGWLASRQDGRNLEETRDPVDERAVSASIVIAASNEVDRVRRCLEAIAQNTPDELYEVVVVDNASTDGTEDFLALLEGDAKVIANETNVGLAAAWNQGAKAAKGEYLVFLSPGCEPQRGWLEALIGVAEADPEVGAVLVNPVDLSGIAFANDSPALDGGGRDGDLDVGGSGSADHAVCATATGLLVRRSAWQVIDESAWRGGQVGELISSLCSAVRLGGHQVRTKTIPIARREDASAEADLRAAGQPVPGVGAEAGKRVNEPTYYGMARPDVQCLVPESARRILDVGCASGALGQALKARQWCEVIGIECVPEVADLARSALDQVYVGDVARIAPSLPEAHFDCIVMADVLEHLVDPGVVLTALRPCLAPGGRLVVSVPNVRHWSVVRGLLEGRWDYAEAGLLDRTHLRFFTRDSIERLLRTTGYRPSLAGVTSIDGDSAIPRQIVSALRKAGLSVSTLAEESRVYQFLYVAEPVPSCATVPTTSIILLTHNQLEHTRRCLESIERYTPEPHELIVVDNASTDNTVPYLRDYQATHAGVRVIFNSTNRGFAAGNNQGLAVAKGQYVLLLNNDTVVTDGWLGRMLAVFERHPEVGIVGPMSNYVSGPQFVKEAAYRNSDEMQAFAAKWATKHAGQSIPSPRVVGFCLLARREVVERIGGLDERFGSGNFEDDDFCIRAAQAGYQARIAQDVFVHHTGSQTFKGAGIDHRESMLRNWELFKAKWGIPQDTPIEKGYSVKLAPTL